jgi:DNA polymerase III sliding clamp (beta) subunit (PCNA family)
VDYEKVLPFKSINDIVKEIKETEVVEESSCDCGNCTCK